MIEMKSTMPADIPLIERWIKADPWHSTDARNVSTNLLTGNGLLSFCLTDFKGVLCFVRLDVESDMVRAAIQFGPEEEVSKRRLALGLMRMGFPAIIRLAEKNGLKGVIFESANKSLIEFVEKRYKVRKAERENDYALIFGE